jgi:hypothetical protein
VKVGIALATAAEVTVGVSDSGSADPNALPLEAAAIADALAEWAAEGGVDHLQFGLTATTPATVAVIVDAVARYRAG